MSSQNKNNSGDFTNQQNERMLDLLVQLSTSGLTDADQQELDQLVTLSNQNKTQSVDSQTLESPVNDLETFDLTAAALDLAMLGEPEEMPDSVRDRVLFDAGQHFKSNVMSQAIEESLVGSDSVANSTDESGSDGKVEISSRTTGGFTRREGLAVAVTAASIMLLMTGWNPFGQTSVTQNAGTTDVQPIVLSASETASQGMDDLIAAKPGDLVRETWTQIDKNYVGAGGEVVWSDEAQEGYMVFTGITPNDPSVEQFQLWIFDTDAGQAHPVDGGVFDIASGQVDSEGRIVVPIKAHIPVDQAVMFAVTVERPGGVTVSKRERIPVLAKVMSGS